MKHAVLFSLALFAAACGPKSKPADTAGGGGVGSGGGSAMEVPTGPLAEGQWDSMDKETREKFMENVVKPTMKPLFQAFDAADFADFDCETCHGAGAKDDTFKMPNPDLPQLSMDMIMNPDADEKPVHDFMMETVKPTMANLLGLPQMDQTHPDGFACMSCHTEKQ